jgi:sialidase-1
VDAGDSCSRAANGLIASWTMDDSDIAQGVVSDRSGNGLDAQLMGGIRVVAGRYGQALQLDGVSGYLTVADPQGLTQLMHDLSFAAWIRTRNSTRTESLLSRYDATGPESGYMLQTTAQGNVSTRFGGMNLPSFSEQREVADSTRVVNDGAWHHVAVMVQLGQSITFAIDGQMGAMQAKDTIARSSAPPFTICASAYPPFGADFTGAIDEVRVYDRALSIDEIADVMACAR